MNSEANQGPYAGGYDAMNGMPNNGSAPLEVFRGTLERSQLLAHDAQESEHLMSKMMENLHYMEYELNMLRRQYEEVVTERNTIESLTAKAEKSVKDASTLVDRYAEVKDAVVASDGYTYERNTILEYLDACKKDGNDPVSHQTNERLSTLLIPNRSLKKLLDRVVELLQGVNLPPATGSNSNGHHNGTEAIEVNSRGEQLHPCIRVYGKCNYKESCAYAKYPFEACLSNLKGKCRFRNQCHERHVEFVGPLNDDGQPLTPNKKSGGPNAGNPSSNSNSNVAVSAAPIAPSSAATPAAKEKADE